MWWKMALVFVSGCIIGGVYGCTASDSVNDEINEKLMKRVVELTRENAVLKGALEEVKK